MKKAQALYERSLDADPENDVLATELAQLLLDQYENGNSTRWTVLKPTEMSSEGGSRFTLQPDGSILVSGDQADHETYSIVARFPVNPITGLRWR